MMAMAEDPSNRATDDDAHHASRGNDDGHDQEWGMQAEASAGDHVHDQTTEVVDESVKTRLGASASSDEHMETAPLPPSVIAAVSMRQLRARQKKCADKAHHISLNNSGASQAWHALSKNEKRRVRRQRRVQNSV